MAKNKMPVVVQLEIDGELRKQHMQSHTTDKYEFMLCGKRFARTDILRHRRHIARNFVEADCERCLTRLVLLANSKLEALGLTGSKKNKI